MVPKIIVELGGRNPDYRAYSISTEISQIPLLEFFRPLRESSEKYLKDAGEVGSNLVRQVLTIPGVNEVLLSPYRFVVIKGNAFDWEEIGPPVLEALKQAFGETEQEVVVIERGFERIPTPPEEEVEEAAPEEEVEESSED